MRVFIEEQRFTQPWLIILLIITTIPSFIIITNIFVKTNEMNLVEYICLVFSIIIATGLIFTFKLKTRIDDIGIHYQFFPFHFKMKTIFWKNIKHAETRKYDALSEFGGWGIKGGWQWKKKNGIAINVKGNIGLQLTLNTDKKILIGTQKKDDVESVLTKYFNKL